jgi:nicotinate-nucleotide pyrophosphorylase (carboxylating)
MRSIEADRLDGFIKQVLAEDNCSQDITTKVLNFGSLKINAAIKAKEKGVLAGMSIAVRVFKIVDRKVELEMLIEDGRMFKSGDTLLSINGYARSILSVERTVLNFLSHLSGIATLTRKFVNEVKPYKVRIMDTRKTTPGLRLLEKYAVRMGGGYNHRYDLSESILIKDNHIAALKKEIKGLHLGLVIKKVKKQTKNKEIEIEVNSIKEFKEAIEYSPDIIMLDNMNVGEMKECVILRNEVNKNVQLEISGNVNLENVKALAGLGVERISIGSLTHSPKAVDISLEFIE